MSAQPPPPPSPPPVEQPATLAAPSHGPGRKWYVVALVVLALIGGPSLFGFLRGLDGITNGLTRVVIPGATEVELERGTWTIFYEYSGEHEGTIYNTPRESPGMHATLTGAGGELPISGSTGSFTYNIGGHAGHSIGEFSIEEPGTYTFEATLSDRNDGTEYLLALGKDLGKSTVLLVFGVIGMIAAGTIALLIFVIVIILRSRAKRKLQQAGYSV